MKQINSAYPSLPNPTVIASPVIYTGLSSSVSPLISDVSGHDLAAWIEVGGNQKDQFWNFEFLFAIFNPMLRFHSYRNQPIDLYCKPIDWFVYVYKTLASNRLVGLLADWKRLTQPAFTCSKLTIETLVQGMKYVQS